jgi:hypothetical protein
MLAKGGKLGFHRTRGERDEHTALEGLVCEGAGLDIFPEKAGDARGMPEGRENTVIDKPMFLVRVSIEMGEDANRSELLDERVIVCYQLARGGCRGIPDLRHA